MISGSRDRTIRIWDLDTMMMKYVICDKERVEYLSPNIVDFMAEYEGVLAPGDKFSIPLKRKIVANAAKVLSYPMCHTQSILCLQYDDEILVTGSSDCTVIVHSMKSGDMYQPLMQLRGHGMAVLDVGFNKDFIVTSSKDYTCIVWDRKTGGWLHRLQGHTAPVNAVEIRGNVVVSVSGDFSAKMWSIPAMHSTVLEGNIMVPQQATLIRTLEGHTKGLACVAFSQDGKFLITAGNDHRIRIWDAMTGHCIRIIKAHSNLIRSIHLDDVSGRLVSGSYDDSMQVFDLADLFRNYMPGQETVEFKDDEKDPLQVADWKKAHETWIFSAKSDYRRLVSAAQDGNIMIQDFGYDVKNVEELESVPKVPVDGLPITKKRAGAVEDGWGSVKKRFPN